MSDEMHSAENDDALHDLSVRLIGAAHRLDEMAPDYWEVTERARLRGKAEGVRLALSYVEEALRTRPIPPTKTSIDATEETER